MKFKVWPFKWKLLSSTFLSYSLLCCARWFWLLSLWKFDHSNESYFKQYFPMVLFVLFVMLYKVAHILESGWNRTVWPIKMEVASLRSFITPCEQHAKLCLCFSCILSRPYERVSLLDKLWCFKNLACQFLNKALTRRLVKENLAISVCRFTKQVYMKTWRAKLGNFCGQLFPINRLTIYCVPVAGYAWVRIDSWKRLALRLIYSRFILSIRKRQFHSWMCNWYHVLPGNISSWLN